MKARMFCLVAAAGLLIGSSTVAFAERKTHERGSAHRHDFVSHLGPRHIKQGDGLKKANIARAQSTTGSSGRQ
jgi:hypothetical protein